MLAGYARTMFAGVSEPRASQDGRIAARAKVAIRARLRDRGTPFEINIVDLSATGFRAETVYNVPLGLRIFVTLPGLSGIEATAVWRGIEHVGFAFKSPLHPAVFDHIVASLR